MYVWVKHMFIHNNRFQDSIEYRLFLILFLQNCFILVNFCGFIKLYSLCFFKSISFQMQLYKKDNNGVNNPIVSGLSFNNFHEVSWGVSMRRRTYIFSLSTQFLLYLFQHSWKDSLSFLMYLLFQIHFDCHSFVTYEILQFNAS